MLHPVRKPVKGNFASSAKFFAGTKKPRSRASASLAHFGQIDASFPSRIMEMAEKAQAHTCNIENSAMAQHAVDQERDASLAKRGQTYALLVSLVDFANSAISHPVKESPLLFLQQVRSWEA